MAIRQMAITQPQEQGELTPPYAATGFIPTSSSASFWDFAFPVKYSTGP